MMGSAFWFLMRRSARNRLIRQLDRLKEPRYLIALVVGAAYLWFFLFARTAQPSRTNAGIATVVPLLGSLLLFIAVARWWAFGGDRRALSFTPAEIQFLFPAPIARQSLIHWKLLRWQILIVFNTILWLLIAGRARPPIPTLLYLVALWIVFSTLSMHRLGSALTKAGVAVHWRSGLQWQSLPLLLVLAGGAALLSVLARHWTALSDACCGPLFLPVLQTAFSAPLATVVLFPFQLLTAPLGATTVLEWVQTVGPALALLGVHYVWVMRSQVAFEEAAIQASAETAARLSRSRGEQKSRPRKAGRTLPLAAKGWPGTAIVWKNIIAITRGSLARSALIALMVIGAALATVLGTPHRSSTAVALGTTCVALVGFLSLLGPTWIRNDLRGDLMYLSLLRSYPLRGRTIVVAEVLGSVVSLTFLQLLLLAGAYGTLSGSAPWNRYLSLELSFVLAVPVIVVVNTIGLTIQNAGALLFPAWVRFEQYRPGGFDTLGQNILTMLFTMLLSALALVGPTLLGWTLWTLLQQTMGVWGILPAIAAGLALGVLELAGLIIWLGRVFERTESTA